MFVGRGRDRTVGGTTVRIAALFLGLMAGLFALLAPSALRVDLLSPFLEFWAPSSSERLLGTMVWYAIAGAALLGGLLATITPGFAALLLLGAAVGWFGVAVTVPQLLTYHLLAPAGAAALGALFAFFAGELQVRRRRIARRNRKLAMETIDDDTNGEIEREAALRMDPMLMPRQDPPPAPKRPIPLTLSDVTVTSRPANDPLRWQDLDSPQPPPRRRDPDIWAEARREPIPFAEEVPAARQAPEPRAEARGVTEPRPEPQGGRRDAERPRPEPQRRRAVTRAERSRVWVAALAAVAAVLGLGIIAAGGYLLNRDGSLQALFGPPSPPAVVAAGDVPAQTVAPPQPAKVELPTPAATIKFPKIPTKSATAEPAAAAPASPPAEVAEPSSAAPLRVAAAPAPESYDEPFSYCRAVGTIDHIDHRYAGPAVTEAMTRALLIPASSPRDRVRWRCFDGAVLACTSYIGPICDTAPTVLEMREFCERNPNVDQLMAPSGVWSCADGRPQLPPDASWPVDGRGFLPQGWIKVPDPGAAPPG
jgi:hypothetical protein